jgi:hypothetical protein
MRMIPWYVVAGDPAIADEAGTGPVGTRTSIRHSYRPPGIDVNVPLLT